MYINIKTVLGTMSLINTPDCGQTAAANGVRETLIFAARLPPCY